VNEVELVLLLVGVRPGLHTGGEDPGVGSEGADLERRTDLPDNAVAELVEGRKRVTHGR
jgi:hypothetical protein